MTKPTVHYSTREDVQIIRLPTGKFIAKIFTLDHPRLRAALIGTSSLTAFDPETGWFETRNSHYKPADDGR